MYMFKFAQNYLQNNFVIKNFQENLRILNTFAGRED